MVHKCCVVGCKSHYTAKCHRIPSEKRDAWLIKIGRSEFVGKFFTLFTFLSTSFNFHLPLLKPIIICVLGRPADELTKLRICHVHFTPEMMKTYGNGRVHLKDSAEPVLFVPKPPTELHEPSEYFQLN